MSKQDAWMYKRAVIIAAVTPLNGLPAEDPVQDLVRQVAGDYVRLTDVETVRLHGLAVEGTSAQQAFALDALTRNAAPIALELAFQYSTRFGGLLEAWDGALWQLNKLLPRVTETKSGELRKTGWNPHHNGVRWLTWVRLKLQAELPDTAERLVDEKRASGAGAAIAAGRSRLMNSLANDAGLYTDGPLISMKARPAKQLPKGRKNLVVKRGAHRVTGKALATAGAATQRTALTNAVLTTDEHGLLSGLQPSRMPITAFWVARAIRANARALLMRPAGARPLSDRAQREALVLSRVTEEYVNRNAKSIKLDATVGEDQDERLSDIIAAEEREERIFEAPLHHADATRALAAFRRYGPVHGDVLTKLNVRAILPTYRRRLHERKERQAFQAMLERAGMGNHAHVAVSAARLALTLTGTPADAPLTDVKSALRGVQGALRGARPTPKVTSAFGTALAAALTGTALQTISRDDAMAAKAIRAAHPDLKPGLPLAAVIGYDRKLARHGKADRAFVTACRNAGVRIRQAEDALALVNDAMQLTTSRGERVRVTAPRGYVRPWQLAIEQDARDVGDRADQLAQRLPELENELREAEARVDDAQTDTGWLAALDDASCARDTLQRARAVRDVLRDAAADLESAATDAHLARAIDALTRVEAIKEDECALNEPDTWWADAYHALDHRPDVQVDLSVPF